jgi:hypothetical protein
VLFTLLASLSLTVHHCFFTVHVAMLPFITVLLDLGVWVIVYLIHQTKTNQFKMTVQQLINNAKKLNAEVYTETVNDHLSQIGIRSKSVRYSGLIHWFDVYTFTTGEISITFNHSYSQNNGKTKKGVLHGLKIQNQLGFFE